MEMIINYVLNDKLIVDHSGQMKPNEAKCNYKKIFKKTCQ